MGPSALLVVDLSVLAALPIVEEIDQDEVQGGDILQVLLMNGLR